MQYALYFEWSADEQLTSGAEPEPLDADHYEAARVMAAILYAGASFMKTPPDGFRIIGPRGEAVYRYPEPTTH